MATVYITDDAAKKRSIPAKFDAPEIPDDIGMLVSPVDFRDRYIQVTMRDGTILVLDPSEVSKVDPTPTL